MSDSAVGVAAADRPVLEVSGLTKRYGARLAVDGLDLRLPAGSVTGFVGPNGAGKTTTIRMLLGLISPTAGRGTVLGIPLGQPAGYLSRVGAMIEGPAFYPRLSGRRNLDVLAVLGGHPRERVAEVLERVGLADRADDHYRSYSLGMKQRLGIAAALLPQPTLLLLDEPANGLDPAGIRDMRGLLRGLADDGLAVFVSSHLLAEIQQICDSLVMISDGQAVFTGTVDELLAAEQPQLVATPEHSSDLVALQQIITAAGYRAEMHDGEVTAFAPPAFAAELNRSAMAAGITLVGLGVRAASLEEAFFSMTGGVTGDVGSRP
jgi:ABC-2 type transport system ATP-binding protein